MVSIDCYWEHFLAAMGYYYLGFWSVSEVMCKFLTVWKGSTLAPALFKVTHVYFLTIFYY